MVGIMSYGVHLPRYRLPREKIYASMGWFNPATRGHSKGEKAVANYDEDSLSLGVEAARACLEHGGDRDVKGLYFASTTLPYIERQNSTIMASALNLSDDVETADFTGSLRAGTSALLAAFDAVASERRKEALAVASDSRLAKVASAQEHIFGDAAAAFLVGEGDVLASLQASYTLSCDLVDSRRTTKDDFGKVWEDRWIREIGYSKLIQEALAGLLKQQSLSSDALARVVFPCPYPAVRKKVAKKLGIDPAKVQENVHQLVGDAGVATPLLMLAAALEEARPGDLIAVVSYGNGTQALLLKVEKGIEGYSRGLWQRALSRRAQLSYEKYLAFKELVPLEVGIRGEEVAPSAMSALWRERKAVLGLVGSRCKRCGTPVYPPQKVCVNPQCKTMEEMEAHSFAEKRGKLFTFTADNLAFSVDPPALYGMVDFEGGGRYWFDLTDCALDDLEVGMEVKMSFRRKYVDKNRSILGYFWKAVPVRGGGE